MHLTLYLQLFFFILYLPMLLHLHVFKLPLSKVCLLLMPGIDGVQMVISVVG